MVVAAAVCLFCFVLFLIVHRYLCVVFVIYFTALRGWDVARLVRVSGSLAADSRFDSPVRQGIFIPESTFSADSLSVSVYTPVCGRMH